MTGSLLRVLLIGANGQLGQDLQRALGDQHDTCIPRTHAELEVCDQSAVEGALRHHQPDVVINTSAYHRVDEAESNPEKAFRVNAVAVGELAAACKAHHCALVHLSTDYVFGGARQRPWEEDERANPMNVYGVSKLAGEYLVACKLPEHYIIRTSGLYGLAGSGSKGGNFVESMLRLARERDAVAVVGDQILTPTYTVDLARTIVQIIHTRSYGLYHVTNSGECSWFEFARQIFDLTGTSVHLTEITTARFNAPAARPAYSVLAHTRLRREGLDDLPDWRDALARYLVSQDANTPIVRSGSPA
jgi:dTDP-4-dehydrorhamnose reductase